MTPEAKPNSNNETCDSRTIDDLRLFARWGNRQNALSPEAKVILITSPLVFIRNIGFIFTGSASPCNSSDVNIFQLLLLSVRFAYKFNDSVLLIISSDNKLDV